MPKSSHIKKPLKNGKPRNYEYPAETHGTRIAKSARAQASSLTEEKRGDLFKRGMQVIYGGTGNTEKVSSR